MKRALLSSLVFLSFTTASAEISTQIYNGTSASTSTFPSFASLYFDSIDYGYNAYGGYCGATVLDATHILTAAHCIYDGDGSVDEGYALFTMVVPQLQDEDDYFSSTQIRAKNFYAHPDYVDSSSDTTTSWPNDIAIIELESAIPTSVVASSEYVSRASASPTDGSDTDDTVSYRVTDVEFIVVGHGETEDEAMNPNAESTELLQTTLRYQDVSNYECDFDSTDSGLVSDSQLCMAGDYDPGTHVNNTSCSGDSGGPVYWWDSEVSEYKQAGIVSYGWSGCYLSTTDDTSVHTEVADYEAWIDDVLSGDESDLVYTATDSLRSSFDFDTWSSSESSSSSSGGTTPLWALISLTGLFLLRRRK